MNILTNKVALITEAASCTGKAIAERYAALGANVMIHYSRDRSLADQVAGNISAMGAKAAALPGRLCKLEDIENLFSSALAAMGSPDIVVVHSNGQAIADALLLAAAAYVKDEGRLIVVGCNGIVLPTALLSRLSKELGPRGVTVNAIIPYAIDRTGIDQELRALLLENCPMGRLAELADIANVAEFFAGGLSSFVSGQHLYVNGGAADDSWHHFQTPPLKRKPWF